MNNSIREKIYKVLLEESSNSRKRKKELFELSIELEKSILSLDIKSLNESLMSIQDSKFIQKIKSFCIIMTISYALGCSEAVDLQSAGEEAPEIALNIVKNNVKEDNNEVDIDFYTDEEAEFDASIDPTTMREPQSFGADERGSFDIEDWQGKLKLLEENILKVKSVVHDNELDQLMQELKNEAQMSEKVKKILESAKNIKSLFEKCKDNPFLYGLMVTSMVYSSDVVYSRGNPISSGGGSNIIHIRGKNELDKLFYDYVVLGNDNYNKENPLEHSLTGEDNLKIKDHAMYNVYMQLLNKIKSHKRGKDLDIYLHFGRNYSPDFAARFGYDVKDIDSFSWEYFCGITSAAVLQGAGFTKHIDFTSRFASTAKILRSNKAKKYMIYNDDMAYKNNLSDDQIEMLVSMSLHGGLVGLEHGSRDKNPDHFSIILHFQYPYVYTIEGNTLTNQNRDIGVNFRQRHIKEFSTLYAMPGIFDSNVTNALKKINKLIINNFKIINERENVSIDDVTKNLEKQLKSIIKSTTKKLKRRSQRKRK